MSAADEKQALKMLLLDTNRHRVNVIRDDGVHRHIRFKRPGTGMYHFDLITWPGHLVISGDLQDYHFARLHDMFEFFRNPVGYINPTYWAEKLCGHHQAYEAFSEAAFRRRVWEHFRDWCEWHDGPHRPLWQAIRRDVLEDSSVYDEAYAHQMLRDFRFDPLIERIKADEQPVPQRDEDFVPRLVPKHSTARPRRTITGEVFEFTDSWEWDLRDFQYHFLLSLHAIVWGINRYDELRKKSPWVSYDQWALPPAEPDDADLQRRRERYQGLTVNKEYL